MLRIYPAHQQVVEPPPPMNDNNRERHKESEQRLVLQALLDQDPDTPDFDGSFIWKD